MKKLKVNIVVGGRFHSSQIYNAMRSLGYDVKIYSSSPKFFFRDVPNKDIIFIPKIFQIFQKIIKKRVPRSLTQFDNTFFRLITSKIMRNCDILWGFNGDSLDCGIITQKQGGVYILDRACPHITFQQKILLSESIKLKYEYEPLKTRTYTTFIEEYNRSDFIVVPSEYSKQSFSHEKYFDKVKIIPLDSNIPAVKEDDLINLPLIGNKNKFKIGIVGGSFLRKGIIYLLRAIRILNNSEISLLIRAPESNITSHAEAKKLCSELDVEFIPHLKDLNSFYKSIDILVLPSIDEGFGMVVYEAIMNSTPVIASRNVGSIDGMTTNENIILVDAANESSLASAINELYINESMRLEIGKNGKIFHSKIINNGSRYQECI